MIVCRPSRDAKCCCKPSGLRRALRIEIDLCGIAGVAIPPAPRLLANPRSRPYFPIGATQFKIPIACRSRSKLFVEKEKYHVVWHQCCSNNDHPNFANNNVNVPECLTTNQSWKRHGPCVLGNNDRSPNNYFLKVPEGVLRELQANVAVSNSLGLSHFHLAEP